MADMTGKTGGNDTGGESGMSAMMAQMKDLIDQMSGLMDQMMTDEGGEAETPDNTNGGLVKSDLQNALAGAVSRAKGKGMGGM